MQMLMNTLNPNQQQQVSNFKNISKEQQAETIAKLANEKGLNKDDLQQIINMLNGKK